MIHEESRKIIEQYVEAYNSFDIEGMVNLLHEDIVFQNFSGGKMNVETKGTQPFRELAQQSSAMFSSRRQKITHFENADDKIAVHVDYEAIVAIDLPNGLKAGDKIELKGKSLFQMEHGQIIRIEDHS